MAFRKRRWFPWLVLALVPLIYVIYQNWKVDPSTNVHYLDSAGLAAAEWLSFILITFASFQFRTGVVKYTCREEAVGPLRTQFGTLSWQQLAKALWVLIRMGIVVSSAWVNFRRLPPRDPTQHLNQAKYLVVWFEFPIVACFLLLGSCSLCVSVFLAFTEPVGQAEELRLRHLRIRAVWIVNVASVYDQLGQFSVLKLVRWANLGKTYSNVKRAYMVNQRRGRSCSIVSALANSSRFVLLSCLGTFALMLKLGELGFVSITAFPVWNWKEWLLFVGFVNALAGLMVDERVQGLSMLLRQSEKTHQIVEEARSLTTELVITLLQAGHSSSHCVICLLSLTVDDVCLVYNGMQRSQINDDYPPEQADSVLAAQARLSEISMDNSFERSDGRLSSHALRTDGAPTL